MNFLRNMNWLWLGIGAVAGWFVVPQILQNFGITFLGMAPTPYDPWNANFGTWRPMGRYGIGGPLTLYKGGGRQRMGTWEGQTGELGQSWGRGRDILPFGLPWEYR